VLEAADAAVVRLGDDARDRTRRHVALVRARARGLLLAAAIAVSAAVHAALVAALLVDGLRALVVEHHADFRRHQALADRVSLLVPVRRTRLRLCRLADRAIVARKTVDAHHSAGGRNGRADRPIVHDAALDA